MTEKQIELLQKLAEAMEVMLSDPKCYSADYIVDKYIADIVYKGDWDEA